MVIVTRGIKGPPICTIDGCERKFYGKNMCELHYSREKRKNAHIKCSIDECDHMAQHKGYCARHYTRLYRYGDPLFIPPKKPRTAFSNKGKLNFFYDLREKTVDTPVEFNKIFKDKIWEILA